MSVARRDDLRAKAGLSPTMVNLMQLQADDDGADIHPLHNQNGRQTTQVCCILFLYT